MVAPLAACLMWEWGNSLCYLILCPVMREEAIGAFAPDSPISLQHCSHHFGSPKWVVSPSPSHLPSSSGMAFAARGPQWFQLLLPPDCLRAAMVAEEGLEGSGPLSISILQHCCLGGWGK